MKSLSRCSAVLILGILLGGCGLFDEPAGKPPIEEFKQAKGRLGMASYQIVSQDALTRTYDFRLGDDATGQIINGRFRVPQKHGKYPVVFVLAAFESGKDVVDLLEGCDGLAIVSIDYPIQQPDLSLLNLVPQLTALHDQGVESVGHILLTLDWLAGTPPHETPEEMDSKNLTVAAVSFGTFTAIPAAAMDPRVSRLAVIQGGGDLPAIVEANAARLQLPLPPIAMGWLARRYLSDFEPNRYIGMMSPRPVVIFASENDTDFPRATTQSLLDHAGDPKQIFWHPGEHFGFNKVPLIHELSRLALDKLYGPVCTGAGK